MAVPFRRTSKTKKRMRRTHFKLHVTGLVTCSNCGELIPAHTVCPKCGFYRGENVLNLPEASKAEVGKKKAAKAKAKAQTKAEPAAEENKKAVKKTTKTSTAMKKAGAVKPVVKKTKVIGE